MNDHSLTFPFVFMRHGETDWNRDGLTMGVSDISLNETGRAQAKSGAARLAGRNLSAIWTSPLARTRETAEIVAGARGLPISTLYGLMERNWGIHEGRPKSARPAVETTPEGGESHADFQRRCIEAIATASASGPGTVLIVSHSGVWRALCAHLEWTFRGRVANAMPYLIEEGGYSPL